MSTDLQSMLAGARRAAIERGEKEYKLQCDVFDSADRKAQGTTTIAGALLAADLGFVAKLTDTPSPLAIVILLVITGALGCSVLMALWALYARDSDVPATGNECEPGYSKLISRTSAENFATAEAELLDFVIGKLKKANESVTTVAATKANWVQRSQHALFLAAAATIVLTTLLIFNPKLLTLATTVQVTAAPPAHAATNAPASAAAGSVTPALSSSASISAPPISMTH
ncbi:hypothetical protein QM312_23495 [Burkholderia cenocepacia]|uniref:hypothetical protein n=1 Tax=Burkholderia cenocepacia TaxID=95486 RepID=UPI0024B8639C|nr:hypothetical protein [Burkholderia cenocepacia]MDI9698913.1 hypothetical protein [Burkholderia cenocepacia]